jgi:UDP-N-acetylglucosamine acyltransferase
MSDNKIHKTAIIDEQVKLGKNVSIGPYTVISQGCQFYSGAVIGSPPQDRKHHKTDTVFLVIGANNVFREYVTVNPGTIDGGGSTSIGNNNLFMACSHVAHDCQIGNDCILANYVGLSGHVTLEDRVVVGGISGIHQYVRLGHLAMIGGCSKVTQDVPPFALADGNPAALKGLNIVGLKRAKIPSASQMALRRVFKVLFNSGLNRSNALLQVKEKLNGLPEVHRVIEFIQTSKRGIA